MKNLKIIFYTIIIFSFTTVSAQYGYNNGYGNGYGNSGGYGRQRLDSEIRSEPEKPQEIPVDVTVGEIMQKMKTALKLDVLQEIAISNVLKESIRDQGILIKDEKSSPDQKNKEFEALVETTNRKVNEFLNPDQKEKYKDFIADKSSSKKSKRKK